MIYPCIDICEHYDITDDLISKALDDEKKIKAQKGEGNPTTVPMAARRDYWGSLAQNGIFDIIRGWEHENNMSFGCTMSAYFNEDAHQDKWDLFHRDNACDIMGFYMGDVKIVNKTRWMRCFDHKKNRDMDKYIFVGVDTDNNRLHVAGIIPAQDYWTLAEPYQYNDPAAPDRWKRSIVEAKYLHSFRDFMFGT